MHSNRATRGMLFGMACLLLAGGLQGADPAALTLQRIFSTRDFRPAGYGPVHWLSRRPGYLVVEKSPQTPEGQDIVCYEPESGRRTVLVPALRLVPPGKTRPLQIDGFQLSPGEDAMLIYTRSRRVWRRNTRGDYWVLDLAGGGLRRLGGDAEASSLMFAKFSPRGDRVAYAYRHDIYVQNLSDLAITRLTTDGSKTTINGTFDWVYEEELNLRDGFSWSPDGRHIAFWQLDSSGVRDYILVNYTDSLYPVTTAIPYPKAGETNSAARVGVVPAAGGPVRWLQLPGDPRNHYIARMDWTPDSREVAVQYLNRRQNENRVMFIDIRSGKARTVFIDRSETWVDVCADFTWLDGKRSFLFVSERDGWRHAYRVTGPQNRPTCITPGEFDITAIVRVDKKNNWLYYTASPENPTQRYLFRTRLDGEGTGAERLTPRNSPGWHDYRISGDSRWAVHRSSAFGVPETVDLVRLPDHERVRILTDNQELKNRLATLKRSAAKFLRVDIGEGAPLDAWLMKPPDFDPHKRYPLLFYVYGEPWGQTVQDRWSRNYLWHLLLTQRGYVVMSVDNRGTAAPRGREWRHCIYGQVGILASRDQAAALEALKKRFSWVDGSRIGIWGWSGGGSMSLNMIFRYPELYQTAMAVAFVANQRYYDSIYQERYMGLPADNPEGYRLGSPITFARQLQGHLLLVHGTGDDNVHYQNCEALVNELIAHNKPFTMMAYPNRTHAIREGENTTIHLFSLLTRYLEQNLPPGPR